MTDLLALVWLLLPAAFANMSAVVAAKLLPALTAPIDFGATFRGRRVLGSNKTWRGLVAGMLVGEALFLIQRAAAEQLDLFSQTPYDMVAFPVYLGVVLGFGALLGDAVKSFFKRQAGFAPGYSWLPFDQIDWILGGLLLSWPFISLVWWHVLIVLAVGFVGHIVTKFVGYRLHIDKEPI